MNYWSNWPKCEYNKDLQWAAEVVNKYLTSRKFGVSGKPDAIVFDIDETLIFGDPEEILDLEELTYTVDLAEGKKYTVEISPANLPIIGIVNTATKLGIKIILLTARLSSAKIDTIKNMEILGIHYDKLIMNSQDHKGAPKDPCFKLLERKKLAVDYNIVATIGDQLTDLYLPGAKTLVVKLPDVKSKCSYVIPPV